MELIADIFLVAGALGAGFYCFILARRLARFNDLEKGMGGAVAVLSAQVDDLTKTVQSAQRASTTSTQVLEQLTERAESVAQRLELLMASLHDLPEAEPQINTSMSPVNAAETLDPKPGEPMFVRHARN